MRWAEDGVISVVGSVRYGVSGKLFGCPCCVRKVWSGRGMMRLFVLRP